MMAATEGALTFQKGLGAVHAERPARRAVALLSTASTRPATRRELGLFAPIRLGAGLTRFPTRQSHELFSST